MLLLIFLGGFVVGNVCCINDVSCEIFSGSRDDRRRVVVMISVWSAIDLRYISLSSRHLASLHAIRNSFRHEWKLYHVVRTHRLDLLLGVTTIWRDICSVPTA